MNDINRTGPYQPPMAGEVAEATPQQIGRYRVQRLLGEGGFGLVYLAHDEQLQRLVAVKVPHPRLVGCPEDAEAYLTEARTVAGLDHPNIVPVYDVGSSEEFPCFVVSKFIEGNPLARKIKEDRPSFGDVAELVATVAEALQYAHRKGLVHRDIKPGNILLDKSGKPYVADFGMALREQDVGQGPRDAGTPAYMSPEQARGEGHRVDGRSDIFSLGVVVYELLTGRKPFHADSLEQLLEQITNREVRPPRQWDDTIPKKLERICLKALSKRLSDRYTTARDMADDLRHFFGQTGIGDGKAVGMKPPSGKLGTRNRRILWGGIIAGFVVIPTVLMLLKISGFLFYRENPSLPNPSWEKSDLVEVFHVGWLGGGFRAILQDQANGDEGRDCSSAYIINPDVTDVCTKGGCVFTFGIQPKPDIPWVRVDGIDIVVHEYKDVPKYRIRRPQGDGGRMHVYYVEIDKPRLPGGNTFSANYFFQNELKAGQDAMFEGKTIRHNLEFVRLVEGKPEEFFVRVNAKTPGVYTFSAVIRNSYKDVARKQTIVSSKTVLFDRPRPSRR